MRVLYVDAGTLRNGMRGFQQTTLCITNEAGVVLYEKMVGDFTNNEGEVLAILAALELDSQPKTIYSDSRIAINWITKGWKPKYRALHRTSVGEHIHWKLSETIAIASSLLKVTQSTLLWIPREQNKAGWHLEEAYSI